MQPSHDQEFGKTFSWDIDMLSGYPYRVLQSDAGATPMDFWKCRAVDGLRNRLRAAGAKAVWIQGWQVAGYWQAALAAAAAGAKVWLRGESNDLAPVPGWKRFIKRGLLGWLFSRIDRFLYIGSGNKRLYKSLGVPESHLVHAPYAVDNERFAAQAAALRPHRLEIRRRWGIANDALCVLFCGKFIGKKRPMDLVQAARLAGRKPGAPNIHLLFVGAGELGEALRSSCNVAFDADGSPRENPSAGAPKATFAGFLNQTEISQAYVAADYLALLSDHGETWGLVVNEALASGLPSIVSDACGCAEDLVGPEWTFPLGDVHALAERLIKFDAASPAATSPALPSVDDTLAAIIGSYAPLGTKPPTVA
jgi:glycosyltransferase involved in cell wall biosynthesis